MTDIKAMQLGEILDGTLTIYRRNVALFTTLGIIALAVPLIVLALLSGSMSRVFLPLATQLRMGVQPRLDQWQPLAPFIGLMFGALILYYVATYFLAAGAMRIIADTYLGQRPRLGDAVALGASKMLPLLGVAICKVALIAAVWIGCVLCVVLVAGVAGLLGKGVSAIVSVAGFCAAVWVVASVMCGYGLTAQVLTLEEGVGVFGAFGRSWELTRGRKGKVFGTALVGGLVFYLVPYVLVFVVTLVVHALIPPLGRVFGALSQFLPIVSAPLFVSCFTLLYYDLRVRREAFDLQLLSARLGAR